MCVVCVTVAGTLIAASQLTPVQVLSDFATSQKTLTSFSGTSAALSSRQKVEIKSLVDGSPLAESVVCTGLVTKNSTKSALSSARNRAKAACEYAQRLNAGLETTVLTRTTSTRANSGKVTLLIRTPKESDEVAAPAPQPSPGPTPQTPLPVEGTNCSKIGQKVADKNGFMKCVWQGGPTEDFLKNVNWRYFTVNKVSTSASNNYTTTPQENAACTNSGDTFDISGGILECRWIAGKKLNWIKINSTKTSFTNAASPVPIDICKLQNSASSADRTGRNSGSGLVGFPLVDTNKNRMNLKGTNEVLIVPIDFPDFPGGSEVLAQLEYDKKWMTDWYSYFSNGQAKFNITTIDKWVRMPNERAAYPSDAKTKDAFASDHGRRMADQAQPFIDQISKEVDLRRFSTVYFFYPDGEITFVDFIIRNQWFKTKEGDVQLNVFSWGKNLEGMETLKWSYYIHETLHDFNISMHAPGNGWPFSIGTNQSGISLALNPWEQFLFDWLPADQIYCDDVRTLKSARISLSPVEREDRQTKMAVIRLSATRAIVVESHGIDKWSNFKFGDREFPPGFYSVMAYIVDLDKNAAPPINSDGTSRSNEDWAWAVFQKVEGGRSNEFNLNTNGVNLADHVAVLGDSFLIEGVRIKFVSTGDYETIEISRG